ncbi:MAG: toll/interleukin-1 receptor domain-containing protein [Acidobacteria bacterium]|nr:toll/interleukin-1 receptor domain-containing protein [Acidobacteriota bacterium]
MSREWTLEHFAPTLESHLEETLPHEPAVFLDRTGIEAGDPWPHRLRQALNGSRCMVAVLCPSYLRSAWCVEEFNTMAARPGGRIIPIQFCDGEHYPPELTGSLQLVDFRDFAQRTLVPEKLAIFERRIAGLCQTLAGAIQRAPEWKADWPVLQPPIAGEVPVVRMPRVQ